MKILHTADWHIGQFKGPVVDGVNLRSQDTVKCLEYMVQVAIEEKPDIVCVSGDIFHQEQVGPVRYLRYGRNAQNIQFHTSKTRERPGEKCRKPLASMDIIGRKKHWKA